MPPRRATASQGVDQGVDRALSVVPQIVELPEHPSPLPEPENPHTPINNPNLGGPEDDDPLENPFLDSTPNLAQAIMHMTRTFSKAAPRSSNSKVKEPDTFDGSDPRKLSNFILLCNLYFRNNSAYSDDDAKVTFALSHLRGVALEFFEPTILAEEHEDWMDDWSAFIRMLRTQFGPIDPTADAEDGIDNLKMRENQRIVKYNVDFNRLAIQTGWDDSVLRHRYYSGLAERIKDIMGQQGKPTTLDAMKTLAHHIDARHWERLREKSRTDKSRSDNKSDNKSDKKPNHQHTPNNNNSHNHGKKNNNQSKDSTNKQSTSGSSVAPEKLGKDGKLTPQERQRRFDNNLCMFCGGIGHKADSCPKSTSSASKTKAKARAAQVTEKTEEPKK